MEKPSDISSAAADLQTSLGLNTETSKLEISLIKASDLSPSRTNPTGVAGEVTRDSGGYDISLKEGCKLHISLKPRSSDIQAGTLEIRACQFDEPFIIMLRVRLLNRSQPYFMIPAVLYGTNRADRGAQNRNVDDLGIGDAGGYGGDPQLTYRAGKIEEDRRQSPDWHFRADRSSAPHVSANFDGTCVALGIGETTARSVDDTEWTYNSLGIWTHSEDDVSISIVMGTLDWPARIIGHIMQSIPSVEPINPETAVGMKTEFFAFSSPAQDRFAYEPILMSWYDHLRDSPRPGPRAKQALQDVANALVVDGIDPKSGYFPMFIKPEGIAPISTLLAWAGILQIARPLIRALTILDQPDKLTTITAMVDRAVSESYREKSGLFCDIYLDGEWQSNNWWPDLGHTSLINGHASYLLLKMYENNETKSHWAKTASQVLAHAIQHQREDGRFPSGFDPQTGAPKTHFGFGGAFFVAPLLLLHRLFDNPTALVAAQRALDHYWQEFCTLEWSGVDMDCRGAVDCGSSYALSRALVELHRQTADADLLNRLKHVLHYASSYRFAYNTRHRNLACDWSSCGSKVTSTHNVHLDAYGGEVLEDFQYCVDQTGDTYFSNRIKDSLAWARQAYNRTEAEFGWGKVGWATEQYYHTFDHYHHPEGDGTVWISYFPWAAGSLLNHFLTELDSETARR